MTIRLFRSNRSNERNSIEIAISLSLYILLFLRIVHHRSISIPTAVLTANGNEYSPDFSQLDDRKIIPLRLSASLERSRFPKVTIFRINTSVSASSTCHRDVVQLTCTVAFYRYSLIFFSESEAKRIQYCHGGLRL